jgi:proteasome component ECM29
LIYEIGDSDLKAQLVRVLVSTFTEGKRITAQSVSNDTQLFSGDIASTPDGGNLNTYQSILSLAADMNQPDLVYKFMSLASHHAIWNSRRGASMGFTHIASQAEKELEPFLPKLVPRLYRYQFDPHPKTAQGMKNIWRSLVKDPVKSIDVYFDEIIAELLNGMGDRQWRTREASAAALSDLLHGRQLDQIQAYMTQLWTMCFRALDDIKESVRKAAFLTCKTLTNLTTRYANPTYFAPSKSQKIMDDMIPFLLEKGLGNMAKEVQQFSLATILKLCKTGGILLKPHLTNIIGTFLESLSSLEPQSMNYLSLNADKYNISQDALDSARLTAAKTSPIMDTLDQCVQFIDSEILKSLVPRVILIIRKGVGLPTRAGTARFIYTLVNRFPRELAEHADSILKALSGAIFDRTPAVRKSFSAAAGFVCKIASIPAVEKFASYLKDKYLDANDEEGRSIAPITFLEISRNAPNVSIEIHEVVLPLAFIGARDTAYPDLASIWEKVWSENTGGSTSAIKKWKKELLGALSSILKSSPSWELKKQVGKGFVDFIKALGFENMNEDLIVQVLTCLSDSLGGRTWDGKETLLEALATLALEGKSYFLSNERDCRLVEDIMIREAKKNNKAYKRFALEYLGRTLDVLLSNRMDELFGYLCEVGQSENDEMDDISDTIQKPLTLAIRANAFKSLGLTFPTDPEQQGKFVDSVGIFMGSHLSAQVWNVRLSILEGLKAYLDKLKGLTLSITCSNAIFEGLLISLADAKYKSVRETASKCFTSFREVSMELSELQKTAFIDLMDKERDLGIQSTLRDALKMRAKNNFIPAN